MRRISSFEDERRARELSDVLFASNIDNDVRTDSDGGFGVWVHRDDQLTAAHSLAAKVDQDPDAAEVRRLVDEAEAKRKRLRQESGRSRHREVDMRRRLRQGNTGGAPVTWGLIGICVLVAILTRLGENNPIVAHLLIGHPLWAVLTSQPWRLITPIFLHFGLLHIGFNMLWLNSLGTAIERWLSSLYLLGLVLVSGVLSNLAQFFLVGSSFGGMSGVVYALLGFIWMRGRFDPGARLRLPQQTVVFMLAWMALGFVGLFNMANYAHLGGLVVGAVWGYLSSGDIKRRLRRS